MAGGTAAGWIAAPVGAAKKPAMGEECGAG